MTAAQATKPTQRERVLEAIIELVASSGYAQSTVAQIARRAHISRAKFYEEFCLLDQPFIKESSQTIAALIASKVAKLGENISVRRFARFKVGAPDWTVAQTAQTSTEEGKA